MKQVVILFFGLMLTTNILLAQRGEFMERPPEERAEIQTKIMTYALALSDSSRIDNVHDINLKYARKMEKLTDGDSNRRVKFRKMRSLSEDKDNDLKKALTSEQYEEYLALKEQWRERLIDEMQKRREEKNGNHAF